MTRQQCKEDVKRWQMDSATGGEFFSVDRLIDKIFSNFEVNEYLYEAHLKDKDKEIERLKENQIGSIEHFKKVAKMCEDAKKTTRTKRK